MGASNHRSSKELDEICKDKSQGERTIMTQEVLTRITAATAAMLIGYLLYKVGLELWCVAYGIFI